MTAELDEGRREIGTGLDDLRRHMHVLHEDTLDRIRALAFDPNQIRREFREADDMVRKDPGERLEPLETFVRNESRKRKRQTRR